jgi:hypothetical protein
MSKAVKVNSEIIKIALMSNFRYKKQRICADEVGFILGNTDISVYDDDSLTEVEIKTSKSDMWQGEKRKAKKHRIYSETTPVQIKNFFIPNYFYICVPESLVDEAKRWVLTTNKNYGILIYNNYSGYIPADRIYTARRAKALHIVLYDRVKILEKLGRRLSSDNIVMNQRFQNLYQTNLDLRTKVCCKCHEEKFLIDFHKAQSGQDGRRTDCKRCVKLKFIKYCKENPWYKIFYNIKNRCENPASIDYQWYGGKGIKCLLTKTEIKQLWVRDGADKMKRPSIDRLNSNYDYTLSNCRFIEHNDNCTKAQLERWHPDETK